MSKLLQSNPAISELLGERILEESEALNELSQAFLHFLRPAKRKNHRSDQTPAKRLKPWGADTVIQHSIPMGVLGEINAAMIYRFPELGGIQEQHGDNVQTAEEMADGNASSFVGEYGSTSPSYIVLFYCSPLNRPTSPAAGSDGNFKLMRWWSATELARRAGWRTY